MPHILALQAVILPAVWSLITQLLCSHYNRAQPLRIPLLIVGWLIAYSWIINGPNFPPRQANDWLGIITLAALLPFILHAIPQKISRIYLTLLAGAGVLLALWPILSYEAALNTHALIWAEATSYFLLLLCKQRTC